MKRSKMQIDWQKVDRLLEAHCTGTEIAAQIGVHPETLYDRVKEEFGTGFSEYSRQKKEKGNSSLKFTQYTQALKGDKQMLIWLGKNWLGQKDEPKHEQKFDGSLAELLELLKTVKGSKEFEKKEGDANEMDKR